MTSKSHSTCVDYVLTCATLSFLVRLSVIRMTLSLPGKRMLFHDGGVLAHAELMLY